MPRSLKKRSALRVSELFFVPKICIFKDISYSFYMCSERSQRQLRNFKELFAERNTYDRDAPYAADYEIAKSHPPSVHNKPDNINQERNRPAAVYNFSSERPE